MFFFINKITLLYYNIIERIKELEFIQKSSEKSDPYTDKQAWPNDVERDMQLIMHKIPTSTSERTLEEYVFDGINKWEQG